MPRMLRVHRSNRTETLVEILAALVRRPAGGPIERECIVVQGRGMERWLAMELAQRLGVWANPDFPFPRRIVERALSAILNDEQEQSARIFEPETLMWSVADILPALVTTKGFEPIQSYLANDRHGRRRFQLAERIADTFDHYTVYRPEMVLGWEEGRDSGWQAILWRVLIERHGSRHLARRSQEFLQRLADRSTATPSFPRRVCLFGISTLPPLYLQVLAALCREIELHLFLLSPSGQYWADIRSQREAIREVLRRGSGTDADDLELHLAEGNPLLASLGRLGRDFQHLLEAETDYVEDDPDLYADPGTATMLATLQSDILNLRARRAGDADTPPLTVDPGDRSIAVHACHSAMREVEVLHDQLLALFEEDPSLQPHDVVVMTPDINAYAPFIEAVFRPASDDAVRIPHRIADRSLRVTSEVVDAFATVLATLPSRMSASSVLDLLGIDAVRSRFGIEAADLDLIRRWISESGIRWAVDEHHRAEVGQPDLNENTWRFGFERLLLGYALPGGEETLYEGVLPYDDVEGTTAQLLGRVVDFCETLFSFRELPSKPRPVRVWREELTKLLAALIAEDKNAQQHQRVRDALVCLEERSLVAGFDGGIDFDSIRHQLDRELQRDPPSRGFLAGGVTFCELVPMRTIPFRAVCLLGMNDGSFPRLRRPLSFDLIAQRPARGDRSQRDDDRYLFLEALLSARDRLLITYVGQSINDNAPLPPSVVVSELLDTLSESFRLPTSDSTEEAIVERVVARHPLQPFSPSYFRLDADPRLFSFSPSQRDAARAMCAARGPMVELVSAPLPDDGMEDRSVDVDDLVRFFENPSRFFLQRRLGIYLGRDIERLEDREPLSLEPLDRWKIATPLLKAAVRGLRLDDTFPCLRAGGQLPIGAFGRAEYDGLRVRVGDIAAVAVGAMDGEAREPIEVDGEIDGRRITGVLRPVFRDGLVDFQYSKIASKHELRLWLRHLLLNWVAGPHRSALFGRSQQDAVSAIFFRPVNDPAETLRPLLALYWAGMRFPLPFFPRTSAAYARKLIVRRSSEADALRAAQQEYVAKQGGDHEDDYIRQIYGTSDRWCAEDARSVSFAEAARRVFSALLEHREGEP